MIKKISLFTCTFFLLLNHIALSQNYTTQAEVLSSGTIESSGGDYSNYSILGETFVNGGASGNSFTNQSGFIYVTQSRESIEVDITVFLEGPFSGSSMNTDLNAQNKIPLIQPYNVPPWNYYGTQSVTGIPNINIVDWILIEILEPQISGPDTSFIVRARKAAFILNDGSVKDKDGLSLIRFSGLALDTFHVRILHRNHVPVISADTLTTVEGIYYFDFTTGADKAIGGIHGQNEISNGIWGMIAGDGNASSQVDNKDKNDVWLIQQGQTGYYNGDYNLDSQVDNNDKNMIWEQNSGKGMNVSVYNLNQPPLQPSNPNPSHLSVNKPINAILSWACTDPDNDPLTYDVYFGTTNNPVQVSFGQVETIYNPGPLIYNTTYFWKIIAHDDHSNKTHGFVWRFTTAINQPPAQPSDPIPPDGSVDLHLNQTVSWFCTDPENDPITYDVYFGTSNPPVQISTGQSDTLYDPGLLIDNTTYFWKIVAHDGYSNITEGPVWNFTAANQPPALPSDPLPPDGAVDQPLDQTISWFCSDPENDPLTFDVYFGTTNPPIQVSSEQSGSSYTPVLLLYNTSYYWRVVAHDDNGNATEGTIWSFTTQPWNCGLPVIDTRDTNRYNTVQINNQCWMKENLNIGNMIQSGTNVTNDSIIEKYCYNNSIDSCGIYGGLYKWDEMMDYSTQHGAQGICPSGWHVPSNSEFAVLANFLGGEGIAGGSMKEAGTSHWAEPNTGSNSSCFTALPSGACYGGSSFYYLHNVNHLWTSTEVNSSRAIVKYLWNNSSNLYSDYYNTKSDGFSVRCVFNNLHPEIPSNPQPPIGSTNQPRNITLSWNCSDPENDTLTYDVYFGITNTPLKLATGLTEASYNPGLLNYGVIYYWKVDAYDDHGNVTEGVIWNFQTIDVTPCPELPSFEYGGQTYKTVQIGTQCWMGENLNKGTMIQGNTNMTDNSIVEKYCYNNDTANCRVYGGLYQWDEMMLYATQQHIQGICASGWHLPTDAEWATLSTFLGGESVAGGKLKETGLTHWLTYTGATNESGFTAIPGGHRQSVYIFGYQGYLAFYWTSSEYDNSTIWSRAINYYSNNLEHYAYDKNYGLSVRCIKDVPNPPALPSDPQPPIGSTNQPRNITLSWNCSDPENDTLTYDVFFGITNTPLKLATGLTEASYNPELLNYEVTYYWKVDAYDDDGNISEGVIWSFQTADVTPCPGLPSFEYGGQTYKTVQIGTQCWMKENLNIGNMIQGNTNMIDNSVVEKYCYNNDTANCRVYGGLYQWNEMMQYNILEGTQGICPSGWHIPTDAEWTILSNLFGGYYVSGGKLKATGTIENGTGYWFSPNTGATNESGFSAVAGGHHREGVYFEYFSSQSFHWTSSVSSNSNPWYRLMQRDMAWSYPGNGYDKNCGQSVRCVKNQPPNQPSAPIPNDGSINQYINPILLWDCTHPQGIPITFDVYFGSDNPPSLISAGQNGSQYSPGILQEYSKYYWKIVAHSGDDYNNEGPIWSFTTGNQVNDCGVPFTDLRDGQIYNTVQIGTQCWMAENLNMGITIPGSTNMADNSVIEKYCYNNDTAFCTVYGGLYQWNEMMQYSIMPGAQGICPDNWQIPTDEEWCTLTQFIDSTVNCNIFDWSGTNVGTLIKSNTGWNGSNNFGFSALPGGYREEYGNGFSQLNGQAFFWTSLQTGGYSACERGLNNSNFAIYRGNFSNSYGFSVRCILIDHALPPSVPSNPQPTNGSTNQPFIITLSWTSIDPEADPLTYDVYFGITSPPQLTSTGQSSNNYNPGILQYNTLYYWKIVVHDEYGNDIEGPIWTFSTVNQFSGCGDPFTDLRDGQVYNTVQIGTQCWMAENLNTGTMINGGTNQSQQSPEVIEKYCYNNSVAFCDEYGGLYQWNEMMQYITQQGTQGICPEGWHLPTQNEWATLISFVGGSSIGGGKLKEVGLTHWSSPNTGATDEVGFRALPGGDREGGFGYINGYGLFWTSTENASNAYHTTMYYYSAEIGMNSWNKYGGFSVRCQKD